MATLLEYMKFALNVYAASVPNQIGVPLGWSRTEWQPDMPSGFSAGTFVNGNEVVISYTGTNNFPADQANWLIGAGLPFPQVFDAIDYYFKIKTAYPTANITFTGHSLGAGLASLMSVYFDKQATVFDEAPFQLAAFNPLVTDAVAVWMISKGYFDSAFVDYFLLASAPALNREVNITHHYMEGEALQYLRLIVPSLVGQEFFYAKGETEGEIGTLQVALHSMGLLTAVEASESFHQAVEKLPNLVSMMADGALYSRESLVPETDFIRNLLRHQFGVEGVVAPDQMLTRFAADMNKLAKEGGLTMKDGDGPFINAMNDVSKTLIAFAMQMYYEDTANAKDSSKELFTEITNGIKVNMADVSQKLKAAIESNQKLNLSDAKGFELYFQQYLSNAFVFNQQERNQINTLLPYIRDWYVQAGASGMITEATQNRSAFMLGGSYADALTGGNQADLLVGNAGNDTLTGGQGNDILLGGAGSDTYIYTTGDGTDTILDSDGQGSIKLDGTTLTGGDQLGDNRVHKDANNHLYVQVNPNTLLIDSRIIVQSYTGTETSLGLTMSGPVAETDLPALTGNASDNFIGAAVYNKDPGSRFVTLANLDGGSSHPADLSGNTIANTLAGGLGADIISGGAGNDRLYATTPISAKDAIANGNNQTGSGGIKGDWLAGDQGNDTIVGSSSNDVLTGGGGDDLLIGGAGDDDILGDSEWVASVFDWTVTNNANGNRVFNGGIGDPLPSDAGSDVIYAGNGNDHAWGGQGNDVMFGEAGSDVLSGNGGDDIMLGGIGHDFMEGDGIDIAGSTPTNEGNDWLDGGAGNDVIRGNAGNDIITGGADNDTLHGGAGHDIYIYNKGDGIDTVYDDLTPGANTFRFGAGVNAADIKLRKGSLLLDLGEGDAIHIEGFDTQDALNSVAIGNFEFDDGTVLTSTELLARGFDLDGTGGGDTITGTNITDRMHGYAGDDTLIGELGQDSLSGGDGNDILAGDQGDTDPDGGDADWLDGGNGDDALFGQGGDDALLGGVGNDQLQGGIGNDIYHLNLGDGQDVLIDAFGNNTIVFGGGISANDIRAVYNTVHGNLILHYGYGGDQIALHLDGESFDQGLSGNIIQTYRFADGSQLSHAELMQLALPALNYMGTPGNDTVISGGQADTLNGGSGDDLLLAQEGNDLLLGGIGNDTLDGGTGGDVISGGIDADILYGRGGNDYLNGDTGDDTLVGGSGDDTLNGGFGNDTYLISRGIGHDELIEVNSSSSFDQIVFDADIFPSDVSYHRLDNGDLQIRIADSSDVFTINGWFNTTTPPMESILFGEGTELTGDALLTLPLAPITGTTDHDVLIGTDYDDTIIALEGDDTLDGGMGNDVLSGGEGQDVYHLGFGVGRDSIVEIAGSGNIIQLDPALGFNELTTARQGNDLLLNIRGSNDGLVFKDYYLNTTDWSVKDSSGIERALNDLALADQAQDLDYYNTIRDNYFASVKSDIQSFYSGNGYQITANGALLRPWEASGSHVSQYIDNLYQTITTTYTVNGNTTAQTNNYSSTGGWVSSPELYTDTIAIRHEALVSDDAEINDFQLSQWSFSQNIQNIRATVAWGVDYNVNETFTSYTTTSPIYNGQGVMVGTSTSENSQHRYQAHRDGMVIAIELYGNSPLNDARISGRLINNYGTLNQPEITAGASNNNIYAHNSFAVINGGAGDDTIAGGGLLYGGSGNDLLIDGSRMYGGEGNDTLIGGVVMSTSGGYDTIHTKQGKSTVLIDPDTTTGALIGGDGAGYSIPFLDSMYGAMGIGDWQERYVSGGSYHLVLPEGIGSYDGRLDEIGGREDLLASLHLWVDPGLTWEQAVVRGWVYYIEPLPVIADSHDLDLSTYYEDSNTPVIRYSANDYLALDSYYNQGAIPSHLIVFGNGIELQDLTFSWGQVNASMSGQNTNTLHTTLNISWGSGQQIQVMIPHSDDPIGSGISTFEFADGLTLTMAEMIAMAPEAPTFDPNIYVYESGMGTQYIADGIDRIKFGAGITSDMITLGLGSLMLRVGTNGDEIHIENFDPSNALDSPVWRLQFTDGTSLTYEELVARGFDIYGTSNDEVLTGTNLDNRIYGGGGHDTLIGSGASDTLIGGDEAVTMIGGLGNETFVIKNLDDVIIADPNAGSNSIISSINYVLPENIHNITLTGDDNLTATGNALNNVITGNEGNGTLIASGGDDTLVSGTGIDTLIGNTGNNTFIVNDANDMVIADIGAVSNSIFSSVSYVLPEHVHNLMLTGGADLMGTGNDLDNTIIGNAGRDILIGAEGNDTLVAGTGGGTLIGGLGVDTFVLNLGGGQQTIIDNHDVDGSVIQFGADITAGSILIFNQGADILIRYDTEGDSVLIKDFSPDGSLNGQVISKFLFGDGSQGLYVIDDSGNTTLNAYDTDGQLISNFWRNIDGTYGNNTYNPDGSVSGSTAYEQNGAYTVTSSSWNKTTIFNFDPSGKLLSDSWTQSNGSYGSNFFHADGSSSGAIHSGNGDYETYTNDGKGNTTRRSFTVSDFKWKEAWTKVDGSEGYSIYNTDGSFEIYINDGKNNTILTNYDAGGNKVSDSYTKADGSYGEDAFYEDGSSEGAVYYSDGSYSEYFSDGEGGTYSNYYDAFRNLSSDSWTEADGTSGSNIFNADGSYISIVNDGQGNITTGNYDVNDTKLSDSWTKTDGSYGDNTFNADGSSSGTTYHADGSYSTYTDDGQGNVLITNYDADGNELLISSPLSDQLAIEDISFNYVLPPGSFGDGSERLSYAATLSDGSPLPDWLSFDAGALTFSGIPDNDVVGSLEVLVTAISQSGSRAVQGFVLNVENVNDDPSPLEDVYVTDEDTTLMIQAVDLLDNDFDIDPTQDDLNVVEVGNPVNGIATLDADGNVQFIPDGDYSGQASFDYTVADTQGGFATTTVSVEVQAVNDAPTVDIQLENQFAVEDIAFSFSVPAASFSDVDRGDSLTYTATLANSDSLPAWLSFDPTTRTFSGTPGNSDVGNLSLRVIARDLAGASASDLIELAVNNVNDAPVTVADSATVREDQVLEAGGNLLANDSDIDAGTRLHIADAGSRTGIYGSLQINTDGSYRYVLDNVAAQILGNGESAIERFSYAASDGTVSTVSELAVTVYGENDAPDLTDPLAAVNVAAGTSLSWKLPTGAFVDADIHDSLTYTVTLENGAALPSWLSFDPITQLLTGMPSDADAGTLHLNIAVSDGHGGTASGAIELGIVATPEGKTLIGTPRRDTLVGTPYDDVLDGRSSIDTLIGGDGNDLYLIDANHNGHAEGDDRNDHDRHHDHNSVDRVVESANGGFDTVWSSTDYALQNHVESLYLLGVDDLKGAGNGLGNLLAGNRGANRLDGQAGNDLLLGNAGDDRLLGGSGNDALDGGSGNDVLEDGAGSGFLAGGKGNDIIRLGTGNDIIAYNRGDGQDRIENGDGQNDVLSLSGGIRIADLKLSKQGQDLVLATGGADAMRFTGWYKTDTHKSVAILQIVAASSSSASGQSYEYFNFSGLVGEFDKARAANKGLDSWAVSNAASRHQLGSSNTESFGGALATAYAQEGNLEDLSPETVSHALTTSKADAEIPASDTPAAAPPSGGPSESPPGCDSDKDRNHLSLWKNDKAHHAEHDGLKKWLTPDDLAWIYDDHGHQSYDDCQGRSVSDLRVDYTVSWAYLRDKLAGRLNDEGGAPDWRPSVTARDLLGASASAQGTHGQVSIAMSGNLLKPFEGLKEGFDRLR